MFIRNYIFLNDMIDFDDFFVQLRSTKFVRYFNWTQ